MKAPDNRTSAPIIDALAENEIFVFGSATSMGIMQVEPQEWQEDGLVQSWDKA